MMIQNHPTSSTTPAEPKNNKHHHHRGRRGSRRRTSSAGQDDSPALQSIQDLIAEMRRLPHLEDDDATADHLQAAVHDWPLQRSRRHSEPPLGASSASSPPAATAAPLLAHSHPLAAMTPPTTKQGHDNSQATTTTIEPVGHHLAVPFPKRGRSRSLPHITAPLPPHHNNAQAASATARRQLYATHLPIPDAMHLVERHELYAGTLAVDWQDSSDAHVACEDLGRIYIYGSRNRNRALHGDVVAVELVDVETMMAEKAAKKQARRRSSVMLSTSLHSIPENAQSPTYCGRVVSILERPKRRLFSGTLAIDRPSSNQEHQNQHQQHQHDRKKSPPKIIWFVPADKRLPLVAVPVKHAPSGFLKHHEEFKNRIFTGSIQRWPVTSLHPFGSIEREIGWMGELSVHSKALMSDHHLKDIDFTPAVLQEAVANTTIAACDSNNSHDPQAEHAGRLDLCSLGVFTMGAEDHAFSIQPLDNGLFEVGVHAADVACMIRPNTLRDREARERAMAVHLVERTVPMFPEAFAQDHVQLIPGKQRLALSVLCRVSKNGTLVHTWIGKTRVQARDGGMEDIEYHEQLLDICRSLQTRRVQQEGGLGLAQSYQRFDVMSDSKYPRDVTRVHEDKNDPAVLLRELLILAGQQVAQKILSRFSEEALLCRQAETTACSPSSQQDLVRDYLEKDSGSYTELIKTVAETVVDPNKRDALLYMLQPNPAKYVCSGTLDIARYRHDLYAVPLYTNFVEPLQKYACLVVQRQLHAALRGDGHFDRHAIEKVARHCNAKESGQREAERASTALYTAAYVYRECLEGRPVIQQAVVIGVQPNVLTVYIPDYDLQKDVHLLNHPGLLHTTFHSAGHTMELTWEGNEIASLSDNEDNDEQQQQQQQQGDDHSDLMLTVDDDDHGLRQTATSVVEFMSCVDIQITSDMKVVRPSLDIQLVNPLLQP